MRIRTALPIAVVGLLLAGVPAGAHHALIAQFALDKSITLRGTVTKMEWVNPHPWIHMDVKGADGRVENWAIETGSPQRLVKAGLKKTDFKAGTEIIVGGFAAKDGRRTAAGWIVTFPDREASYLDEEASFSDQGASASFPLGR